jgi:outer membrane protein
LAEALKHRPELASARLHAEAERKFAYAERDLNRPTVTVSGVGGFLPYINPGNANPQIPSTYEGAAVNVQIPIFNGFEFNARRRAAEYQFTASRQHLRDLQNRVVKDVRGAWEHATASYQAVGATAELLKQANLALELARGRYDLGLASIVELSQAQLGQTTAQIAVLNAGYEYREAYAALQYELGRRQ